MASAAVFLIDGFEETEALTTVDILRRGGVEVTTVSLTGRGDAVSSRKVSVRADALFDDVKDKDFDMLVIPGGTVEYARYEGLRTLVQKYDAAKKRLAAICAAPLALERAGVLKDRRAVCYPGMEPQIPSAILGTENVVTDGHVTTAKGPAITPFFALKLLELLCGKERADEVAKDFLIPLIGGGQR